MKNLLFLLFLAALFVISVPQNSAAQNKSHWVSPKAGVWQMTGKDEENINWKGQIVFTKKTYSNKSIVKYAGYIDWNSPDDETSGLEYFTGSFDRRTGKLVLKGNFIENCQRRSGTRSLYGFCQPKRTTNQTRQLGRR